MSPAHSTLKRFANAPSDIKTIAGISLLIVIANYILRMDGMRGYYEQVIPFTGWVPDMVFTFVLLCIFFMMTFGENEKYIRYTRLWVFVLLSLSLCMGIHDWANMTKESFDHPNPYLRESPFKPCYTVVLPLLLLVYLGANQKKEGRRISTTS